MLGEGDPKTNAVGGDSRVVLEEGANGVVEAVNIGGVADTESPPNAVVSEAAGDASDAADGGGRSAKPSPSCSP